MVNIDERLSKRFAKNVHKIKRSANIRECEDLLLFKRRADIIGLYDDRYNYMKYGVLRLSPEGVFIYSSDHRIRGSREDQYRELIRIITGIGYASSSPISIFAEIKRLPIDDDGVRVTYENEAGSPHQLLLDGTIDPPIPER
ncbi:hypothetical protein KY343_06590, partial [Candidatus Woesearchaeota archaeon]|nr:hypothetical protein [Candidatus Woesearchaeota archaeon]